MSGGGKKILADVLDPGGVTGLFGQSHFGQSGVSLADKFVPRNLLDPAGIIIPLEQDDTKLGSLARRYGLNDPLNLGGNGGLNTSGQTDYTRAQDATAEEEALRNTPLPPLSGIARPNGLGQGYTPQPILAPSLLPNPKRSAGIRDRAFAQVLAPLLQQGWGLGQAQMPGVGLGQIQRPVQTEMYRPDPNEPQMWL